MNIINPLFGFDGRIRRLHWWLGTIAIEIVVAVLNQLFGIPVETAPTAMTPLMQAGLQANEISPLARIVQNIPVPRPGTPEDIAAACEFLCSERASYITGQEINVNGGSWM